MTQQSSYVLWSTSLSTRRGLLRDFQRELGDLTLRVEVTDYEVEHDDDRGRELRHPIYTATVLDDQDEAPAPPDRFEVTLAEDEWYVESDYLLGAFDRRYVALALDLLCLEHGQVGWKLLAPHVFAPGDPCYGGDGRSVQYVWPVKLR
ncbi:hypothetical protein EV189_1670 [Motilibacter rhizosphaerae]|uniref:Uncharacterized protein n=1 Tax=Motilibacter rhizosphaerae TaxID=598652 RepID=A0A4Q7NU04_9ACTN|nr:hypothetical protein [Motilibacter rhizosphaerae]RZS89892.1 hypothetical protein EV189_1670 [Motilibacter rhizosphaerae]